MHLGNERRRFVVGVLVVLVNMTEAEGVLVVAVLEAVAGDGVIIIGLLLLLLVINNSPLQLYS